MPVSWHTPTARQLPDFRNVSGFQSIGFVPRRTCDTGHQSALRRRLAFSNEYDLRAH